MKYIVEDGFSKIHKTGIGQYTLVIEKLLGNLNYDVVEIEKTFLSKLKNKILRRFLYNIWLNSIFLIKLLLLKDKTTVIFTNYAIPIWKICNANFITVIHDLCSIKHAECDTKINNWYQILNIKNAIKNADKIITVSETIKEEIIETFHYPEDNIKVIYNSFSFEEGPIISYSTEEQLKILDKYNITSKNYILSVATLNKRKNITMLIDAYCQLDTKQKLVLVGGTSNEKFNCNNPNIIFTGYIKDNELKVLYKHAKLYIFPSLYEGFGIPIIDAQAFSIPVLCSDIPVFREIASSGAEYCDLLVPNIAKKIETLINNTQRREELVALGKENIKRFNLDVLQKNIGEILKNENIIG